MLAHVISLALRFRGTVIALACLWLAYGMHVGLRAKLDVFPDFLPPQVTIQTEAPGLAPEQVEALVTRPSNRLSTDSEISNRSARKRSKGCPSSPWFSKRVRTYSEPGRASPKN